MPSAELVAEWYAKLPPGSDIEDKHGLALRSRRTPLPMALDRVRSLGTYDVLGAASYRMPRVQPMTDLRGGGGRFMRRPSLRRQRRILRMLADGATVREVQRATGANFTVIAAVRRAALKWTDPDDRAE